MVVLIAAAKWCRSDRMLHFGYYSFESKNMPYVGSGILRALQGAGSDSPHTTHTKTATVQTVAVSHVSVETLEFAELLEVHDRVEPGGSYALNCEHCTTFGFDFDGELVVRSEDCVARLHSNRTVGIGVRVVLNTVAVRWSTRCRGEVTCKQPDRYLGFFALFKQVVGVVVTNPVDRPRDVCQILVHVNERDNCFVLGAVIDVRVSARSAFEVGGVRLTGSPAMALDTTNVSL